MRKLSALCLILSLTGCEAADPHLASALATAMAKSTNQTTQPTQKTSSANLPRTEKPQTVFRVASAPDESCDSTDPRLICLGLKYIVYEDGSLNSETGSLKAISNVHEVNKIWEPCQIRFSIRDYALIKPSEYGLKQKTSDYQQLQEIRKVFQPKSHERNNLLLVVTDNWNRSGSLGNSWANAWTNLPGESLLGSVLERHVGDDITIIAHELGHYLSLDHEADWKNLMNPLIFENSRTLDRSQCASARWAAGKYFGVLEP